MSDANAADLYYLMTAGPLVVVFATAILLSVLHVLALHGRRVLPRRLARIVGWLVFGLLIGLTTQLLSDDLLTWLTAGAIAVWTLAWAWREGRLGEAGVALIGGALPWLVSVGLLIVLQQSDPTVPVTVVGALVIAAIGVLLVIGAPRSVPQRKLSPVQRATLLAGAINRAQAMGPVPAPLTLAFVAGTTGTSALLILLQDLDPTLRLVIAGTAFIGLSLATWWVATPRRVIDAQAVIWWLVHAERRMWAERLGRPLPRTPGGIRDLLDSLPDVDSARPLRVEMLAIFGRTEEARHELARLPMVTSEERAVEAELAEYVGWYEGSSDEAALDRWARELPSIEDPAARLRLRVSLAVSRARRAALERDPAAIDHLLAVRAELGSTGSRFRDPGAIATAAGFVTIGLVVFVVIPLLAGFANGVQ